MLSMPRRKYSTVLMSMENTIKKYLDLKMNKKMPPEEWHLFILRGWGLSRDGHICTS